MDPLPLGGTAPPQTVTYWRKLLVLNNGLDVLQDFSSDCLACHR
jgi:hypothetical protein